MPQYRRWKVEGGLYFFTVVTHERRRFLTDVRSRRFLREAFRNVRRLRPFQVVAIVLIPDHFHVLMGLPEGDHDFSPRIRAIKHSFTRAHLAAGGVEGAWTLGRLRHRNRGVWQKRFHEHLIRDDEDFANHVDYIHYNPVKHGYVDSPGKWPWSSFHRCVRSGLCEQDWQGPRDPDVLGDAPEFE